MDDLNAMLEKLRSEAEDCDLISGLAADLNKREFFTKLAVDLRTVANDLEALPAKAEQGLVVMQKRRPSEPHSFKSRIENEKKRLQVQADLLPLGLPKETLLEKIRQLDTANDMNDWLRPPGLRPPQ